MSLAITALPLPHVLIKQLLNNGIHSLADILQKMPWFDNYTSFDSNEDIQKLGLTSAHEKLLLDMINSHLKAPKIIAPSDIHSSDVPQIITFSSSLDSLISGGVFSGEVIEFLGEPGSGISQLCHQLAVDCAIASVFGGRQCKALYIDCNSDFCERRLGQIAEAALGHLRFIANTDKEKEVVERTSVHDILSDISFARCTDYSQLIAVIHSLSEYCKYGLVVIDALATHFRHEFDDMRQRTNLLASVSNSLHSLCLKSEKLSVVTVNQTRMDGSGSLQPCLGESWSHTADRRVLFSHVTDDVFSATLMKGVNSGQSCQFRISSSGIRDCPS